MRRVSFAVLVLTIATGCQPSLAVRRERLSSITDQSNVDGLATASSRPHLVAVVVPERPGSEKLLELQSTVALPSLEEMYIIGYKGAAFSSRKLVVNLHPDGSAKQVQLTTDVQAAEDLKEIADALTSAAPAVKAIQEARAPAEEVDPLVDENAKLKLELFNHMLKANKDAAEAGGVLPYPDIAK